LASIGLPLKDKEMKDNKTDGGQNRAITLAGSVERCLIIVSGLARDD
jgi:hypothetical protein